MNKASTRGHQHHHAACFGGSKPLAEKYCNAEFKRENLHRRAAAFVAAAGIYGVVACQRAAGR